ncbi:MAG: TolC family protein [Proteobacteria bacterium]|nr:TolC family protein [Pseudomonadota bacterium]
MKLHLLRYRCCLLALVTLAGFSTPASALDLPEAIRLAFKHDVQLRADTFAAEARNSDGWQSVAGYGPTLIASGSYMRSRDSSQPEDSAKLADRLAKFNEGEIKVGLEQPVFDLEKGSKALQGMAEMDIAELLKKKAGEDLLIKVHERYYAILSAQQAHRLARSESAALLKQVRDAEDKLELGFGTITSQYDAEARYRLSAAAEIARKTDLDNTNKALEEIIDQEIACELEDLAPDMLLPAVPKDVATWLEVAGAANIDINIKELQLKTAQLEYRGMQSRFLPTLVLFADYSERHPDNGLLGYGEERSEADIGLRLEGKILSGGRDTAAAMAAGKRVKAAEERVTAAKRAMNRSVRSLWESIQQTRELIAANKQAVAANEKALESTRAAYDEGAKVLLDVLNVQQDYYRSQRQYKTSRYDYMMLLEKFRQVVGVEKFY